MPWMCGQLQVLRLDFKIGELVRHLAVNVTMPFHLLHPRPLQKQKAYHWRIFTPANNQTIWPLLSGGLLLRRSQTRTGNTQREAEN